MTVTRIFLALAVAAFLVNLYVLIDAQSLMRPAVGEAKYLWVSLLCICGMYFISKEIALYGARFAGKSISARRRDR
jgi:hypothetical protein